MEILNGPILGQSGSALESTRHSCPLLGPLYRKKPVLEVIFMHAYDTRRYFYKSLEVLLIQTLLAIPGPFTEMEKSERYIRYTPCINKLNRDDRRCAWDVAASFSSFCKVCQLCQQQSQFKRLKSALVRTMYLWRYPAGGPIVLFPDDTCVTNLSEMLQRYYSLSSLFGPGCIYNATLVEPHTNHQQHVLLLQRK